MNQVEVFKALSNKSRLQILTWLKDPGKHFPEQLNADLCETGVCVGLIQKKTGLTQSTVSDIYLFCKGPAWLKLPALVNGLIIKETKRLLSL